MNPVAMAQALADFWPADAMTSPATGLPTCIETTRIVVAAFDAAGVPGVRPLPTQLEIYNAEAVAAMLTDSEPTHSAIKIGVGPEFDLHATKNRKGYPAHLVVEHDEFILDLVLGGLIRSAGSPAGFESVGALCGVKHDQLRWVDGAWSGISPEGVAVRYEPRRRLTAWQRTDAWTADLDPELVQILADCLTEAADDA